MNRQAILQRALPLWLAVRHIAFWAKWAFYVFFAIPSVVLCAVLAYCSHFSFSTIPREVYEQIAQVAQRPAAPAGYLTVQKCEDPKADATRKVPVVCKTWRLETRSIDSLADETAKNLWTAYLLVVILGCGFVVMIGSFTASRNRFRTAATGYQKLAG